MIGELPEHPDRPIDRLGRAEEDGDARLGQRLHVLPAVFLLYGDYEVGLQFEDAPNVDLLGPADLRDFSDHPRGLRAVAGAAHDPLAHAEGEERLRQARDQADDALWGQV